MMAYLVYHNMGDIKIFRVQNKNMIIQILLNRFKYEAE